jgi:hypothetical protein
MADPMKIVVDVVNGQKVKDLTEEIKRQEAEILKWNAAMKGASATQQQVLQTNMANAGKAIANAKTEIVSLGGAAGGTGRNLAQLAYAVDDLQYGFNAIVNNIPQIVMGLGGGAGIAGAAGIAAVAINQLIKRAGDLADAFNSWKSGRPADVLKEIREQAEAAAEALDKLSKFTEGEERKAGAVGKFVQNTPKDKFVAEVMDALGTDEAKVERYKKYYEAKGNIGRIKGFETEDERDFRMTQADADARNAEANERRARAEKLVGKALLPGRAGQEGLNELGSLLPGRAEQMQNLARGIDPAEIGQKRRAEDEAARAAHDKDAAATRDKIMEEAKAKQKARADDNKFAREENQMMHEEGRRHEKEKRLQSLEDERTAVQNGQRDFDEAMWQKMHEQTRGSVMAGGAKSLIDMYQANAPGRGDDPKELAKKAHEQRVKTNQELEKIRVAVEKERRFGPQH